MIKEIGKDYDNPIQFYNPCLVKEGLPQSLSDIDKLVELRLNILIKIFPF